MICSAWSSERRLLPRALFSAVENKRVVVSRSFFLWGPVTKLEPKVLALATECWSTWRLDTSLRFAKAALHQRLKNQW